MRRKTRPLVIFLAAAGFPFASSMKESLLPRRCSPGARISTCVNRSSGEFVTGVPESSQRNFAWGANCRAADDVSDCQFLAAWDSSSTSAVGWR